jgi:phosphoglycolate phosphatase
MTVDFQCHAMIFDLDGTLIDSLQDIADATNNALAAFDLPQHGVDDYRRFVGNGVQALLARALPPQWAATPPERFIETFRQFYRYHLNRKTRPYPGIVSVLEQLAAAGLRLAVLSNKPHELTGRCIETFFPHIAFTSVFGQRDGIPRKPDPTAALEIARMLAIPQDKCGFVGDSAVDMATGRCAGMRCIGVSWGFRPREEMIDAGADLIIDQPEELLRYAASTR